MGRRNRLSPRRKHGNNAPFPRFQAGKRRRGKQAPPQLPDAFSQPIRENTDAPRARIDEARVGRVRLQHGFRHPPQGPRVHALVDRGPVYARHCPVLVKIGAGIVEELFRVGLKERPVQNPAILFHNIVFKRVRPRFVPSKQVRTRLDQQRQRQRQDIGESHWPRQVLAEKKQGRIPPDPVVIIAQDLKHKRLYALAVRVKPVGPDVKGDAVGIGKTPRQAADHTLTLQNHDGYAAFEEFETQRKPGNARAHDNNRGVLVRCHDCSCWLNESLSPAPPPSR